MAFDQDSYRFRTDDGSESAATWMTAINTPVGPAEGFSPPADKEFRLRLLIQSDAVAFNHTFELQYRHNEGSWTNVTDISSVIRERLSANVSQLQSTTQQLGVGSFITGLVLESDFENFGGDNLDFIGSDETECEWSCEMVGADVESGDIIELRATVLGSPLDTYTETPTITLGVPAPDSWTSRVPDLMPDPLKKRYTAGAGGHFTEVFDAPPHFDPEDVTADRFLVSAPDVMRRKPWRPEGHFGYTEVPVPADTVVHGWEFFTQRDVRRENNRRWRHLLGTSYAVPASIDPVVLSGIGIVGELTVLPAHRGTLELTPAVLGRVELNAEPE